MLDNSTPVQHISADKSISIPDNGYTLRHDKSYWNRWHYRSEIVDWGSAEPVFTVALKTAVHICCDRLDEKKKKKSVIKTTSNDTSKWKIYASDKNTEVLQNSKTQSVSRWCQNKIHSIEDLNQMISEPWEDKQSNSALVIRLHVGLFIVNTCFIKPALTFVCYFGFDSCNQNWSVYCREAAKSDMTNVGQTVQVFSQSGRHDWSSLESIMIKAYWHWAPITFFFLFFSLWPEREKKKDSSWSTTLRKVSEREKKKITFQFSHCRAFINPKNVGRNSAGAIDFPLIRFFFYQTGFVWWELSWQEKTSLKVQLFQTVKTMTSHV